MEYRICDQSITFDYLTKLFFIFSIIIPYPNVYVFMSLLTVSHFSYAPLFQSPHIWTKMLELNILYDNLLIDILSI